MKLKLCDYCGSDSNVEDVEYEDTHNDETCTIALCDNPECHDQLHEALFFAQEKFDQSSW